ncbi:MAG: SAM-dependent methyltransferase [Lachnospiraceae bacterium]|nr:SAM-dependent methyltransferase [Lachnospiraceae bacterium]
MFTLSKRLEAVCRLIPRTRVLGDIGCDHGYISVSAVEAGMAERAIAADVNKGPLERAMGNIAEADLENLIETRLSDGLAGLKPGECDTIVIAGMGGPLMRRIIEDGVDKISEETRLVLQPQSDIPAFRKWLRLGGSHIEAEDIVFEDGKYYPMMRVRLGEKILRGEFCAAAGTFSQKEQTADSPAFAATLRDTAEEQMMLDAFGPLLLYMRHPVLKEYMEYQSRTDESARRGILKSKDPQQKEENLEQLKMRERLRKRALSWYDEDT